MSMLARITSTCAALCFLAACNLSSDNDCSIEPDAMFRGYEVSPAGSSQQERTAFYEFSQRFVNTSIHHIDSWRTSLATSGEVPTSLLDFNVRARAFCFAPIWILTWRLEDGTLLLDHPNNLDNASWTNNFTQQSFEAMVLNFVNQTRPATLFLSNQDDFYFEENRNDHQFWVDFYHQLYDKIKNISPETQIGITFQYEHISGKGVFNNWNINLWEGLNRYNRNKIDVYGFAVYPFFARANVESIQPNYFDDLFSQVGNKPVMIVETGWPAQSIQGSNPPWQASQTQQTAYALEILNLTAQNNIEPVQWKYLNPQMQSCEGCINFDLYNTMSLFDATGNPRDAWNVWVEDRARVQGED